MRRFAAQWGILCLVFSFAVRAAAAVELAPEVAELRQLRTTLLEKKKADQALLKSMLADGVKSGAWTEADRARMEAAFAGPEAGPGNPRIPPYPGRLSFPAMPSVWPQSLFGSKGEVEEWTARNQAVTAALIESTYRIEYSLLVDFAERVWAEARTVAELQPAVKVLVEARRRDPDRWEMSNRGMPGPMGYRGPPIGVPGQFPPGFPASRQSPLSDAGYLYSIVGSEDGFLPPDPATDINAYLRWKDTWDRLAQVNHRFVRRALPQARLAAMEARYWEVDRQMEQQLVELLKRDAPARDFAEVLKPYLASPPLDPRAPVRRAARNPSLDYQGFINTYDQFRNGFSRVDDSRFGIYQTIFQLRVAEEEGNAQAAAQAQSTLEQGLGRLRPALVKLLADRKAGRATPPPPPPVEEAAKKPATANEALLRYLEAPTETRRNIARAAPESDLPPRPRRQDEALAAILRKLADNPDLHREGNQTGLWGQALSGRFELADLRDRAAREQLAEILQIAPASFDANAPLSVLWSEALESAIRSERDDIAGRLLRTANVFAILPDDQSRSWSALSQLLQKLQEKGLDKTIVSRVCLQILGSASSEATANRAAARLKTLRAEGK